MKMNTLKAAAAVGLTALLVGSAAAQESVSKPVGYETLNYTIGFNYLGLRLVEAPAASGAAEVQATSIVLQDGEGNDFTGAVVTAADGVADALTDGITYIFEGVSGDATGIFTTIESFDAAADTLTLGDDVSGDLEPSAEFIVRPADTLASVFGAQNDVANSGDGLESQGSFGLSDQVWVPDGSGSFEKYAYVQGNPFDQNSNTGWQTEAGDEVTPEDVPLIYTDGVIIVGVGAGDIVISGSVKLEPVQISLTADFNYIGSLFPAGLTLTESGLENSLLKAGSFGLSDQVWLSDGAGGFSKYAFVERNPFDQNSVTGWREESAPDTTIAGDSVSFDGNSGAIVVRAGNTAKMITINAPSFYSNL